MLANIYLHYALDLWFEKVFRKDCDGAPFLVRYANDFVAGFQRRGDANRFKAALKERLGKFKLSLAGEKTGVHMFTRFRKLESKRFDFLGCEYRWGKSRKGGDVVGRLNRRSQKRSFNWKRFAAVMSHYGMERPRITWGRKQYSGFKKGLRFTYAQFAIGSSGYPVPGRWMRRSEPA